MPSAESDFENGRNDHYMKGHHTVVPPKWPVEQLLLLWKGFPEIHTAMPMPLTARRREEAEDR